MASLWGFVILISSVIVTLLYSNNSGQNGNLHLEMATATMAKIYNTLKIATVTMAKIYNTTLRLYSYIINILNMEVTPRSWRGQAGGGGGGGGGGRTTQVGVVMQEGTSALGHIPHAPLNKHPEQPAHIPGLSQTPSNRCLPQSPSPQALPSPHWHQTPSPPLPGRLEPAGCGY